MKEDKVVVLKRDTQNEDFKEFHVKARLSKKHIDVFDFPLADHDMKDIESLGYVGKCIIEGLNEIDGIDSAYIQPYSLSVSKSRVFSWDEILPDIYRILQKALGKELDLVVKE